MATLNHPRNYPFTPNSTLKPPTPTSTSQHTSSPSHTVKTLPLQPPFFPSISSKNNPVIIDDSDLVVFESSKKVKTGSDAPNMFTGTSSSKAVTRKDSISLKSFSQERPEKYTFSMTVEAPNVLTEGAQKKNRAPPSNAGPSDGDHDSKQKDGRYNLRRRNKDDPLTVEDTLFKNSQVMQAHRVNGSSKDEEEEDNVPVKQQLPVIVKEYKASGPLSRSEVRRQGLWSNNRHAPMLEFLTQELPYSQQLKNFKPKPVKKEVKPKAKPHAKASSEMKYEVIELDSEPTKLETIVLDQEPIVPVFPSTPSVKTSTDACEFPQPIDIESISVKHESVNEPELIMDPVDPMIVVSISTQRRGFFNQNEFREKAQLWKDLRRINHINLNRNLGPKKQKLTVKESKRFFLLGGNLYDEVRVGSQFQATVLPMYKPDSDKKVRIVKSVWKPDSVPRESLEKFFEFLEKESQLEITNEQAKIKMLRDFGLDVDKTIEYIRNNKVSFRRLFRTERKKSAMFNE